MQPPPDSPMPFAVNEQAAPENINETEQKPPGGILARLAQNQVQERSENITDRESEANLDDINFEFLDQKEKKNQKPNEAVKFESDQNDEDSELERINQELAEIER